MYFLLMQHMTEEHVSTEERIPFPLVTLLSLSCYMLWSLPQARHEKNRSKDKFDFIPRIGAGGQRETKATMGRSQGVEGWHGLADLGEVVLQDLDDVGQLHLHALQPVLQAVYGVHQGSTQMISSFLPCL